MAKSLTSDIIKLKSVRLSFAQLDKPKAFKPGQDPRFEATFLLDPSNVEHQAQINAIKEAAKTLIKAKWGEKPDGLQLCFGLAENNPKKSRYDGYAGMFYLVTANSNRPTIVTRDREAVVPGNKQWPYSGCYVNTNPTLWIQDNSFGIAIRANLRIVQFVDDGKPFGAGAANPDDEFERLPERTGKGASQVAEFDL